MSPDLEPRGLAPFRVRSFRYQWPADLLTSCAFEMETLILGWYVLVETGSVLMLTLFGSLLFTGTLVAPLLGVVGDRIGHRNVLCGMRGVYTVLATTLMTLAFTGTLTPVAVLVVSGLMGLVRPSDLGVRLALVADNVPAEQLMAAMAISRTTSDMARVGGALAGAGMFAAYGMGPAYVAVSALYLLGTLLTLAIGATPARPSLPDAAHRSAGARKQPSAGMLSASTRTADRLFAQGPGEIPERRPERRRLVDPRAAQRLRSRQTTCPRVLSYSLRAERESSVQNELSPVSTEARSRSDSVTV